MQNFRSKSIYLGVLVGIASLVFFLGVDTTLASDLQSWFAQGRVTEFTAFDGSCELVSEAETVVDDDAGVIIGRGEIYRGALVSDNPMINGHSYIVLDYVEDQETGEREVWVTSFFYPDAVDGAFILPGKGTVSADGPYVEHRGHGIGELDGLRIRATAHVPSEEPGELPCEPLFPPVQIDGVIIEKPGA